MMPQIFLPFLPEAVFTLAGCITLNWVQGYLGRYHLGHLVAALLLSYGIALAVGHGGTNQAVAIASVALGAVIVHALVVGAAAVAMPEDVFVLMSLAWLLVFVTLAEKAPENLTGGDGGLRLDLALSETERLGVLGASVLLLGLLVYLAKRLESSRLVTLLRAFRDNRNLSRSLGLPQVAPLVVVFVLASLALAPFAVLRSVNMGWVLPESFSVETAFILVIALAFGASDRWYAAVLAPLAVVFLEALMVLLNLETWVVPSLYAGLLVLLRWRPRRFVKVVSLERTV